MQAIGMCLETWTLTPFDKTPCGEGFDRYYNYNDEDGDYKDDSVDEGSNDEVNEDVVENDGDNNDHSMFDQWIVV